MKKTTMTIILVIILTALYLAYRVTKEPVVSTLNENMATTAVKDPSSTSTEQKSEVVKDFEGEASPSVMKLDMKTWTWISTAYNDGKIIKPKLADKFKLTFKGKTFSATTDCNGIGGEYTLSGNKITFEKMMSTLMYCEGSQEIDFSKGLTQASSYHFTSKGELVFDLKYDSGVMMFK